MKQRRSKLYKAGILSQKPHVVRVNVGSAFRWRCHVKNMICVGTGNTPQEAFQNWQKQIKYWGTRYSSYGPNEQDLFRFGRNLLAVSSGDYSAIPGAI